MTDRDEYLRSWSGLHGGVPPGGMVGGYLRVMYVLARPAARAGVPPSAVTLAGLLVAALVLVPVAAGGRWLLVAVAVVVVAALADGLDGAVAVLTGRAGPWGAVLDAVCDRLADACFVAALWLAGAPAPWCLAAIGLAWTHEYVRARATAAGMTDVGVVTVSERPTRVIVTAMFLLAAGTYPGAAGTWALLGATAWTTIGAAGLVQLLVVVRRRLR